MINVIKATEIMRKYCPETKLKIKDGCDGLYLTESDIILIGRDWHLGGLLHEITHAILYKEDERTGHDGVFADRFTQIVHEVFEKENAQLKELLKQSRIYVKIDTEDYDDRAVSKADKDEAKKLLIKIDEVLK